MSVWVLISGGCTVILGVAFLGLVLETHLLIKKAPPITTYSRAVVRHWPGPAIAIALVLAFVSGLLLAHFVWDAPLG